MRGTARGDATPASQLSVFAIRLELSRRGLSTLGTKPELLSRLEGSQEHQPRVSVPPKLPNLFGVTYVNAKRIRDVGESLQQPTVKLKRKAHGHLRGGSVWIIDKESILIIYKNSDGFGKGTLSRYYPSHALGSDINSIGGRAARQLQTLEQGEHVDNSVVEKRRKLEHLQLTLHEAFYAAFVLKILEVRDRDSHLENHQECWKRFCKLSTERFPFEYAAYHRYRSMGWLPRSGLKYGVDWVLYKAGAKHHTHASYCIILNYQPRDDPRELERSWIGLQNRLRLVKNVAKTLVVACVHFNNEESGDLPTNVRAAVKNVHITEVTLDRWIP